MRTKGKLLAIKPTSHLNNPDTYRHGNLSPSDISEPELREETQDLD